MVSLTDSGSRRFAPLFASRLIMAGYEEFEKPALTPEERAEQAKLAREIIKRLKEEQA